MRYRFESRCGIWKFDLGYGILIWLSTISIWSSWILIWDVGYGISIWDTVYRYGYLPYRYGHPGYRYGIWSNDMGDDSIGTAISHLDMGYLVTLSVRTCIRLISWHDFPSERWLMQTGGARGGIQRQPSVCSPYPPAQRFVRMRRRTFSVSPACFNIPPLIQRAEKEVLGDIQRRSSSFLSKPPLPWRTARCSRGTGAYIRPLCQLNVSTFCETRWLASLCQ